jgi:PAS domain S-box-containing protein
MAAKVIDRAGAYPHHAGAPEGVEFRLADFAAHLPGFAYIIRRDHSGVYSLPFVSPGFEEKFGISHDMVRKDIRPLRDFYHPQDRLKLQSAFDASAELLTPLAVEYRAYHPLHGEFWVETRAAPALDRDGSLLWHGIALDITARKRAEEELISREREFRTVAESSTDLIFRYDNECRRTYVNPAVCRLFGRSRTDLLGGTPRENESLQDGKQDQGYMDAIRRVFITGQVEHFPVDYPAVGGCISYDTQLIPELDASGSVASVFCVARDVSALKHVERKMGRCFEGMPLHSPRAHHGRVSGPFHSRARAYLTCTD